MLLRLFLLLILLFPIHPIFSQTIQTHFNENTCITIDKNEESAFLSQLCEGALDYQVVLHEDDLRQTLNLIDPQGYEYPLDLWHHVSSNFTQIISPLVWHKNQLLIELQEELPNTSKKNHLISVELAKNPCISAINAKNTTKSEVKKKGCLFPIEQKRIAIVRIKAMQAGDNACYLDVLSLDNKIHQLIAGFEICEQSLLKDWPYYLQYQEQNIAATSCEGDMNCTTLQKVNLVNRVTPLIIKKPKKLFECADENNTYRLQWDGNTAIISFNQQIIHFNKEQLKGNYTAFSGGGGVWLELVNDNQQHKLYSGIGKWGENGSIKSKQGIEITNSNGLKQNFHCSSSFNSEISPNWFQTWEIKQSDQFDFSER